VITGKWWGFLLLAGLAFFAACSDGRVPSDESGTLRAIDNGDPARSIATSATGDPATRSAREASAGVDVSTNAINEAPTLRLGPSAEQVDFTIETLEGNYRAKEGRAGTGLAHFFYYLICWSTDPAVHDGRCDEGPYPLLTYAAPFTLDALYLTALDLAGAGGRDYRLIEAVLFPARGRCEDGRELCGRDIATISGVVYHFTAQLPPFFARVIGNQLDTVLGAVQGNDVESIAAYRRELRTEHAGSMDALRGNLGQMRARDKFSDIGLSLGPVMPFLATRLREATIRRALSSRLPSVIAAEAYALSFRPR